MEPIFTIPGGVFLFLWGLFWEPQPKAPDEEPELMLLTDFTTSDSVTLPEERGLSKGDLRAYLVRVALRFAIIIIGILGVIINFINGVGEFVDIGAFFLLAALYTLILLTVQRSQKDRRLATLFIMGVIGLLLWRAAEFQGYPAENNWAVLAAVGVNFLFWALIGRHYQVESKIEVVGM